MHRKRLHSELEAAWGWVLALFFKSKAVKCRQSRSVKELNVLGWEANKSKCRTASLAHCTVSVLHLGFKGRLNQIAQGFNAESYVNYLVLYEGFDFKQQLGSVLYCYPLCSQAHYYGFHIRSCRLFLSFYKQVFCIFLFFFFFWGGGVGGEDLLLLLLVLLFLDANTRITVGGYRHLWHIQKYLVHLARKTKLLLSLVLNTS